MNLELKGLKNKLRKSKGLDPQDHLDEETEQEMRQRIDFLESALEDAWDAKRDE